MEHPRLSLSMIGFPAEQRATVARFLAANTAEVTAKGKIDSGEGAQHPVWHTSDFREANALLLQAPYKDGGELRFDPSLNPDEPMGVHLSELSIPYAVQWASVPVVHQQDAAKVRNVNVDDPDSLLKTLQYFEALLRPMRTLFSLAEQMIERRGELDEKHAFHLVKKNVLDCILDISKRQIIVRDGLRPVDVYGAAWLSRPISANAVPPGFSVWTMEEAAWVYGLHCQSINLPKRYMQAPVYFRRLPRVRSGMLYPRHTNLMELLGCAALTYDQLCEAPDIDTANLERDLNALYLCRAISTRSQKTSGYPDGNSGDSDLFSRPGGPASDGSQAYKLETVPGHLM